MATRSSQGNCPVSLTPDRIAALERQAEHEPSLAKAQLISQSADRLWSAQRASSIVKVPLQILRN